MAEEKQSVETTPTQDASNHRATKGERKFRKAMTKMGMKPVEGINRVTLKTNKNVSLESSLSLAHSNFFKECGEFIEPA